MKSLTLLSITRKYIGIGLVVYCLLLIASTNTPGTPSYTTSGAPITFLTPHKASAAPPTLPAASAASPSSAVNSNVSAAATPSANTPTSPPASVPAAANPSTPLPPSASDVNITTPPVISTDVSMPPSDTEMPLPPVDRCGSCSPYSPQKMFNPDIMCPMYSACMY